jgi:hypothetical protein
MNYFKKYALEFVLVFVSVVGAFVFEDWRVGRQEDQEYKDLLRGFQVQLVNQIDYLKALVGEKKADWPNKPYLIYEEQLTNSIIDIYNSGNPESAMIWTSFYFFGGGLNFKITLKESRPYINVINNHFMKIKSPELANKFMSYQGLLGFILERNKQELDMYHLIEQNVINDFELYDIKFDNSDFYNEDNSINTEIYNNPNYSNLITNSNINIFTKNKHVYYNNIIEYNRDLHGNIQFIKGAVSSFDELDSLINVELSLW